MSTEPQTTAKQLPTGGRFLTWPERAEGVQVLLDCINGEILEILGDESIPSVAINRACALVFGHVGSIRVTVELLAMACRELGPGQPHDVGRRPMLADLLHHQLTQINDHAQRLRQAMHLSMKGANGGLGDSDIASAAASIVGHVSESQQLLGPGPPECVPDAKALRNDLDAIVSRACMILRHRISASLSKSDCRDWCSTIKEAAERIRKAYGIQAGD